MKHSVLDLRPTQIAVGMREVQHKVKHLRDLGGHALEDYLHKHPVPVVKSPHEELYIVDHHHLVRACWELGVDKVVIEVMADLSHLSPHDFWRKMRDSHWFHPFDQFGNGPHPPHAIPESVRGLADDPFRSIAWLVREAGGFLKDHTPFCEFHWADFFRKKVKLGESRKHFEDAVEDALKLCDSHEASHLPGYTGKPAK